MQEFFIYILFSKRLNKYYVGSTNNIEHRLQQHITKHKGFTAAANDWIVCYQETFETRSDAEKREQQIKAWKSRKKIEQLINS